MKRILVSGCSHVFGHGLPDCIDGRIENPSKYAWPNLIRQYYKCEVINQSEAGNSALNLVKKFINYEEKSSLDAIIVIVPFRERFVFKNPFGEVHNFVGGNIETYKNIDRKWFKSFLYYLTRIRSDDEDYNYISNVSYFYYISKMLNIPLWIATSDYPDALLLENHVDLTFEYTWTTYCGNNNFSRCDDGHYGIDAHQTFFEEILKPWLNNNVFLNQKDK